ncbi:tannase/feruloyl esterase family alpha/beta hydrolase [Streptomyces sp. NPDC058067]|uniref:tannase/feruloyl esterase family alpha/beta hydrolase n=1 Tax=Streptomyces sp. NPDC058067 TaxID=3346324 RepID=UPI0036E6071F
MRLRPVLGTALALVLLAACPAAAASGERQAAPRPPVLSCEQLVPDGTAPRPGVPDFGALPEAPTRITSAHLVGTDTCVARGYIAPQVGFTLKLPGTTWQGRYLQQGCGGYCGGEPDPGDSPPCDRQPDGSFAVAVTDSGRRSTTSSSAAV